MDGRIMSSPTLVDEGKEMDLVPLIPALSNIETTGEGEGPHPFNVTSQTELSDRSAHAALILFCRGRRHAGKCPIITYRPRKHRSGWSDSGPSSNKQARQRHRRNGCNMLHLAIAFLEWSESPASPDSRLAPLILVPVTIQPDKLDKQRKLMPISWLYPGRPGNHLSLAHKLDSDWGLKLPEFQENISPSRIWRKRPRR